jgi:hypothetical protein
VGVAGCLARSDCKERDKVAINQSLQSALRSGEKLTPGIPLEGAINNNQLRFYTINAK